MIKLLKKAISLLTVIFFFSANTFAAPLNKVQEYTLENGLKIFLLEDSTDALIHTNFVCKAGFSSQTQDTNGFFKLYTRLIQARTPGLDFSSIQCNADSSIYSISFTNTQTDEIFEQLSNALFSNDFSDELFSAELKRLKNEVSQNADSLSTYINAAIDSRVFSDAPWKHDSGIYPSLFKNIKEQTARNAITEISNRWYIPKNCALFVYGNINTEKLLISIKNTFGRFYSNYTVPIEKPSIPVNKQRKYVFHNDDISNELTQIVIQYTMLNSEQADLIAATLNNNSSYFKNNILNNTELNIPGDEYINVSSAYKRNSSRLIIQTLMQAPENKKSKITPLDQTKLFVNSVNQLPVYPQEYQFAKEQLLYNHNIQMSNPSSFMEALTSFWPIEEYYTTTEEDFIPYPNSYTASLMDGRKNKIKNEDLTSSMELLQSEEPFIFVMINSKVYKTYKKDFTKAGYEEINAQNSSWYVQEMFKNIADQFKPEESITYKVNKTNGNDNYYYEKNIEQIKINKLSNDIKVISKKNNNVNGISMILSIDGGKLNSSENHGFEEVMVNLMSVMIQKELYKKMAQGLILGSPYVTTKTDISTSSILIDFDEEDIIEVCNAISNAIVYGEIAPADADRAVSSRQYRKRLENGSNSSQMISAIMKSVYGKGKLSSIFDTEKDILQNTDYNSILASYPNLLDAKRFSIIITGNFDDTIFDYLEKAFCFLNNQGFKNNYLPEENKLNKSKTLNVKIRHTFLTDIPAEKAGPQPAVLIPTTEFLDPVIYAGNAPEPGTKKAALYNALINYISIDLQKRINANKRFDNSTVTMQLPQSHINLGYITISNVAHIKEADQEYKNTIQDINNKLLEPQAIQKIVQDIKNSWTLTQMTETATNSGTAFLIQKGLELLPDSIDPSLYLNEYYFIQTATVQDFIVTMDYFPTKPQLRVYSSDSKN